MGRIRTVKPELFKHEKLYELENKSGLPIRLAFIGLLTAADRNGNFKWRPVPLKTDILPYDNVDFSKVLNTLLDGQLIIKYGSESESFGNIPTFLTHQRVQNTEAKSNIPSITDLGGEIPVSNTSDPKNDPTSSPRLEKSLGREGKGKEGKGKEGDTVAEVVIDIPYEKIINYLNKKTGKAFKYTTNETQKYIRGRVKDGATYDDFVKVIDIKTAQWKNNQDMKGNLRPSTLFRPSNFENYLQEWDPAAGSDPLETFFNKSENLPDDTKPGLLGSSLFLTREEENLEQC